MSGILGKWAGRYMSDWVDLWGSARADKWAADWAGELEGGYWVSTILGVLLGRYVNGFVSKQSGGYASDWVDITVNELVGGWVSEWVSV
jgi:hypothetical protein